MAALKKKLSAAPDQSIAQFYKVQGNEWVLDIEGDDAPENDNRVSEYRNNNIALTKERDALKAQLAQVSQQVAPTQQEAKTNAERLAQIEKVLADERQQRAAAEKQARAQGFRSDFMSAAQQQKVRDDKAGKALLGLASQTWREDESGSYKPYDGDKILYSKQKGKETEPMSLGEWMESQKAGDYRDFFAQPVGGGGKGSGIVDTSGLPRFSAKQLATPTAEELAVISSGKYVSE
jgi:hypothetical protein